MKKGLLLVLACLLGSSIIFAQDGIKFHKVSWAEMLQKAEEENKLIFVDAYTTWCGPCKMMDKNVFAKKVSADYYNQNFINYKIDMEKGEGPTLAEKYNVALYPSFLFIASDGTLVHRAAGYLDIEKFIALGETALDPTRQLSTLEKRFANGDRDPIFLKNYTLVRAAAYDGSHVPVAEAYLKSQKGENNESIRSFVFQYIQGADSKLFDHLTSNREDYIAQFGEDAVRDKIRDITYDYISSNSTPENPMPFSEVYSLYKKSYPAKAKQLMSEYKIAHYRGIGDRKGFAKAAIKHYKKYPSDDPMELNEIAWTFYTVIDKKKYLKKALKLANRSAELEPAYYNHDTIAALNYKLGKKEAAMEAANKAISLAKAEGFSSDGYAETTKLIEDIKKMNK